MGAHDTDKTRFSRIVTVVSFYVFSCSCYHRTRRRKESKKSAGSKSSAVIWREEIETGPSFVPHPSSDALSASNVGSSATSDTGGEGCGSGGSNSSQPTYSLPSTPDIDLRAPEPVCLISDKHETSPPSQHRRLERMSPNISATQPKKSHPPVNDLHPPVVSALPSRDDMAWMTMPPPSRKAIQTLNRVMNEQRNNTLGGGDGHRPPPSRTLTVSSATGSVSSEKNNHGGSAGAGGAGAGGKPVETRAAQNISLEMENMMAGRPVDGKTFPRPARRIRYIDDVLDDMEPPRARGGTICNTPPRRNGRASAPVSPITPVSMSRSMSGEGERAREREYPLTPATADWPVTPITERNPLGSPFDSPDSPVESLSGTEMVQLPQPIAVPPMRPLSLGLGCGMMEGIGFDVDKELEEGGLRSGLKAQS